MLGPKDDTYESFEEWMLWCEENLCNRTKDVGALHDLTRLECDKPKGHTGAHRGWFDTDLPMEF